MPPTGRTTRRALVVQHTDSEDPGTLATWLPEAGLELDVLRPYDGAALPERVTDHDALIVLGGPQQAYDDSSAPWLAATKRLLAAAVQDGVATLGICLGAQLLAEACGGVVEAGQDGPELGARLVGKRDVAGADPLVWDTPMTWGVVQWHWDAITELPPGAVLLGSSTRYPNQMFRLGERAWGMQFHPEPTPEHLRSWAADCDAADALLERAIAELPEVEDLWRAVLERFAAVARGEDPRPVALPLA